MKIVIFGLSVSSAWGNGHATLWRGLLRALHTQGHSAEFFERDTAYYSAHRDATSFPFVNLHIYGDWTQALREAREAVRHADVAIVTSYCPDGVAASELLFAEKPARTIFYDMDTPVTLNRLERGESVPYLPPQGLRDFDLTLSYTGGEALERLRRRLQARRAATLYGWVNPQEYFRVEVASNFASDLSYLGTYSDDRQKALEELLMIPAAELLERNFVIGGAMYPNPEQWPKNVRHFAHVGPRDHRAFYSSSPLTLNITRASMAGMGYCPSGRLFEAAACGTAVLSDWWTGLDTFFEPGKEILIAESSSSAIEAIKREKGLLRAMGDRAKERTLDCHTADIRARRLIELIEQPADDAVSERAEARADVAMKR